MHLTSMEAPGLSFIGQSCIRSIPIAAWRTCVLGDWCSVCSGDYCSSHQACGFQMNHWDFVVSQVLLLVGPFLQRFLLLGFHISCIGRICHSGQPNLLGMRI